MEKTETEPGEIHVLSLSFFMARQKFRIKSREWQKNVCYHEWDGQSWYQICCYFSWKTIPRINWYQKIIMVWGWRKWQAICKVSINYSLNDLLGGRGWWLVKGALVRGPFLYAQTLLTGCFPAFNKFCRFKLHTLKRFLYICCYADE